MTLPLKKREERKIMNDIIWKIILFFIFTIIITGLLAMIQQKINLDFEKIVLPQFAPAMGFLLMILIFKSLRISLNFDFNSTIAIKTIAGFFIPIFLSLVGFLVCRVVGLEVALTQGFIKILPWMIGGMVLGALGEEIGWRSFLQPTLEKEYAVIISSIIVGLIWGLWHVGHYKNGALFMVGFLLFTISVSIILAWLLRETQYNLIVSVIFHFSVNLSFLLFFKNSLADSKLMIINGFIWLIPAIGIILI